MQYSIVYSLTKVSLLIYCTEMLYIWLLATQKLPELKIVQNCGTNNQLETLCLITSPQFKNRLDLSPVPDLLTQVPQNRPERNLASIFQIR